MVVGAWGFGGAFWLAGSTSLVAGVVALFLHQPGRPKKSLIKPNPQPIGGE